MIFCQAFGLDMPKGKELCNIIEVIINLRKKLEKSCQDIDYVIKNDIKDPLGFLYDTIEKKCPQLSDFYDKKRIYEDVHIDESIVLLNSYFNGEPYL